MADALPHQVKPHLKQIIDIISKKLDTDKYSLFYKTYTKMYSHLSKSLSITLGKLVQLDPESSSYCLPKIIKPWCIALRYLDSSEEKEQAFRGLC